MMLTTSFRKLLIASANLPTDDNKHPVIMPISPTQFAVRTRQCTRTGASSLTPIPIACR